MDGIQGESKDANHKGWITLSGFNGAASLPGNSAGRVSWRDRRDNHL
ncbi:hypothetical protein [Mixta calida]|nr:hypothetical protein [Mixta calida]